MKASGLTQHDNECHWRDFQGLRSNSCSISTIPSIASGHYPIRLERSQGAAANTTAHFQSLCSLSPLLVPAVADSQYFLSYQRWWLPVTPFTCHAPTMREVAHGPNSVCTTVPADDSSIMKPLRFLFSFPDRVYVKLRLSTHRNVPRARVTMTGYVTPPRDFERNLAEA